MMIPLPEWVLAHIHTTTWKSSIPLEGDLAHKDSMGNTEIIRNGDVQVMSAGTG
jgi:redox-sensitive bicupin YhaK (pirin superfamily)